MKIINIDGKTVFVCSKCNEELSFNEKHDSYYCEKCDEWAEKKCKDDVCCFCFDRPEHPSSVED